MNWHVSQALLARYAQRRLDGVAAASVEAHLTGCASCRAAVPADPEWLQRSWEATFDAVVAPVPGPVERALVRVRVPQPVARLLAATPALRWSWLAAVILALALGVFAAHAGTDTEDSLLAFLALAPVLPVLGVALVYGPAADPVHEVASASPTTGVRLLAVRATAVLASTALLAGLATILLPAVGWTVAAWLLPSLALTCLALALTTALPAPVAAACVSGAWLALVAAVARAAADDLALFRPPGQLAFAGLLLAALGLLFVRRDLLDRKGLR